MAKLIELQEAAKMLGISPEELTDLRSRNEIFGYRDGATWKFKVEEIERVKSARGPGTRPGSFAEDLDDDLVDVGDLSLTDNDDDFADLSMDDDVLEFSGGEDSDSILVSEEELGKSDENTASTIIGEADDMDLVGSDSGELAGESDIQLSKQASDSVSASDVLSMLDESTPATTDKGKAKRAADSADELKLQSDSGSLDLNLEDFSVEGSRIELADDEAQASSSGFGSAIDLGLDDDELVLGSGAGSDVTLGAGDSGISLGNPADSGLSLEDPLELSAGSGVESLELGEDDLLSLDASMGGGGTDDDFMLTPVEDGADEESDSGSQVIALDSEDFDDSAAGMLQGDGAALLEEETEEFSADEDARGIPSGFATASGIPAGMSDEHDGTYSIWNVLSLFSIVVLLGFTGILMVDLINNIWSWGGNYSFNSTIMDAILSMMPG